MTIPQTEQFDAVIIGAGQAGKPLAAKLTGEGLKTALIERYLVGGSCINYGCTPTKAMIASAKTARVIAESRTMGIEAGKPGVNFSRIIERKEDIVGRFRGSIEKSFDENDRLTLIYGEASFSDMKLISVKDNDGTSRRIAADKIFINTGASPAIPDIPGLREIPTFDSTSMQNLLSIPKNLIILGGGYIALEFGQMFRRFGSEVTIIEPGDQLVSREDEDVASEIKKILEDEGIKIHLNANIKNTTRSSEGVTLTGDIAGEEKSLEGSSLMIATGRAPNTHTLNLQNTGVETDEKGFIRVNDYLETSQPGIYALGDVKGGPAFTHISYDDFRIVSDRLFNGGSHSMKDRPVPYVIFIDPQLGRVGLNEKMAKKQGVKYKAAKMPMSSAARAIETGETKGLMKVLIDAENDQILGASILAAEGGEILATLQTAMMGNLPYTAIRDGVYAHPTYVESLNNLFASVE